MQGHSIEYLGLRLIRYPDHSVLFPFDPGKKSIRRIPGVLSVEEKMKNAKKNFKARTKKAVNLVRNSVAVLSRNQGLFLTVTSAGVPGKHSDKIKRLIFYMQRKHGLIYYTWVRELTKSGLVHWHMAAVFRKKGMQAVYYLKSKDKTGNARIVDISNWWASLLGGQKSGNSIRLGWKYVDNRPTKYLLDKDAAPYLTKYLIKNFKNESRARRYGTNLDFLRPVRWDLVRLKPLFWGFSEQIKWQVVEEDAVRINEYGFNVDYPTEGTDEPDKLLISDTGYYVSVYFLQLKKYRLHVLISEQYRKSTEKD